MAYHSGRQAKVQVGGSTVANVYNWTMNRTSPAIVQPTFGNDGWVQTWGLESKDWNGTFEAIADKTDTNGQVALDTAWTAGTTLSGNFYLADTSGTDYYYYGDIYITEASDSTDPNNVARTTYGFQGDGTLYKSWS